MSYEPFGATTLAPVGPEGRRIDDFTPSRTLHRIATGSAFLNLTSTGSVALLTVPAGRRFFPFAVWFEPTINTASNSTPTVTVGYTDTGVASTSFEDFVLSYTFLSSRVAGQYFEIDLRAEGVARLSAPPGAVVRFKVETASAGACQGNAIISGFLV